MLSLSFVQLIVTSCAPREVPRQIGDCWNINVAKVGFVKGKALFTFSYEGMSLQSPQCADSQGQNGFVLSRNAEDQLSKFEKNNTAENPANVLYFDFVGSIIRKDDKNVLIINDINNFYYSGRPSWMQVAA